MPLSAKNIAILVIVLVAHYFPVNYLQKAISSQMPLPRSMLVRPSSECANELLSPGGSISSPCRGMPSGHTEAAAIFAWVLYQSGHLRWFSALAIILIMGTHRILFARHNAIQVAVGALLGIFYGTLYYKTGLSLMSLGALCFVMLGLSVSYFIVPLSVLDQQQQQQPNKNNADDAYGEWSIEWPQDISQYLP